MHTNTSGGDESCLNCHFHDSVYGLALQQLDLYPPSCSSRDWTVSSLARVSRPIFSVLRLSYTLQRFDIQRNSRLYMQLRQCHRDCKNIWEWELVYVYATIYVSDSGFSFLLQLGFLMGGCWSSDCWNRQCKLTRHVGTRIFDRTEVDDQVAGRHNADEVCNTAACTHGENISTSYLQLVKYLVIQHIRSIKKSTHMFNNQYVLILHGMD
jgi:hypothetical protein